MLIKSGPKCLKNQGISSDSIQSQPAEPTRANRVVDQVVLVMQNLLETWETL